MQKTTQNPRRVRTLLGLTQSQLAQLLGVHAITVSKWERGVALPTQFQAALLQVFGSFVHRESEVGKEIVRLLSEAGTAQVLHAALDAVFGETPR